MPPSIPAWAQALAEVDRTRPVRAKWGYWVPEAAHVILPENRARLAGYMHNWLKAREGWLYFLANRTLEFSPLSPTWWRVYMARFPKARTESSSSSSPPPPQPPHSLKSTSAAAMKRKLRHRHDAEGVLLLFKAIFPDMGLSTATDISTPVQLTWYGAEVSNNPPAITFSQQVAWELFEIGFRVELLHLDRELGPSHPEEQNGDESQRQARIAALFTNGDHLRPSKLPVVTISEGNRRIVSNSKP